MVLKALEKYGYYDNTMVCEIYCVKPERKTHYGIFYNSILYLLNSCLCRFFATNKIIRHGLQPIMAQRQIVPLMVNANKPKEIHKHQKRVQDLPGHCETESKIFTKVDTVSLVYYHIPQK